MGSPNQDYYISGLTLGSPKLGKLPDSSLEVSTLVLRTSVHQLLVIPMSAAIPQTGPKPLLGKFEDISNGRFGVDGHSSPEAQVSRVTRLKHERFLQENPRTKPCVQKSTSSGLEYHHTLGLGLGFRV